MLTASNVIAVSERADDHPLGSFLLPEGFTRPGLSAVLQEASVVPEAGRYARRAWDERRLRRSTPYAGRTPTPGGDPVVLVPERDTDLRGPSARLVDAERLGSPSR